MVERRTNKAKLTDPRVPLPERLATWDGPSWLSEHTPITGSVLHGSISRIADNVASHLADVSGGAVRVLRMVLYFQIDEANRIWLTHCGTLKTQQPKDGPPRFGPNRHHHSQRRPGQPQPSPSVHHHASELRLAEGLVTPTFAGRAGPRPASPTAPKGSMPPVPAASGPVSYPSRSAAMNVALLGGPLDLQQFKDLELPAPAPSFSATKAASPFAAAAGSGDGDGDGGSGGNGRFLCVMTGEMYPASERCDVTYKQLLQHWFALSSQLPNEGDRLRAMDTIPAALRRANPSLTREWYLRVRSQPSFLYRTAPVCTEAVSALCGGTAGADEQGRPGTRPGTRGVSAPATPSGGAARAGARAAAAMGRQRPLTAVGTAGPHSGPGGVSVNAHSPLPVAIQPRAAANVLRKAPSRAKSASNGGAAFPSQQAGQSRYTPASSGSSGVSPAARHGTQPAGAALGGAGGFPSMLLPRGAAAGQEAAGGGCGLYPEESLSLISHLYAPSIEQAVNARAATAALPREVVREAEAAIAVKEALATKAEEALEGRQRTAGPADSAPGSPTRGCGLGASDGSPGAAPMSPVQVSSPVIFPLGRSTSRRSHSHSHSHSHSTRAIHRMSTCSDAAEMGSSASGSEPNSPAGGGSSSGGYTPTSGPRMSPPRAAPPTLHTIHEEGAHAHGPPPRATSSHLSPHSHRAGSSGGGSGTPPRSAGSHSVPRMRPPTRTSTDRPPPTGSSAGSRYQVPYNGIAAMYASAASGASVVAYRSLSESGDVPSLLPGGSFNASLASSFGSMASRRSNGTLGLSQDDVRTLRELNDAYSAAEKLTQQLLAQAHEILSEDGGSAPNSRPGSTATSPARVHPPPARGASPNGASAGARPQSRGSPGGGSAGLGSASGAGSRAGLPPAAPRPGSVGGPGPSPLGAQGGAVGRQDSGKRPGSAGRASVEGPGSRQSSLKRGSSNGSGAGVGEGPDREAAAHLPPIARLPSGRSATGGEAQQGAGQGEGTASSARSMISAVEGAGDGKGGSGAGAAGVGPPAVDMLTSAEADLLAEALRDG